MGMTQPESSPTRARTAIPAPGTPAPRRGRRDPKAPAARPRPPRAGARGAGCGWPARGPACPSGGRAEAARQAGASYPGSAASAGIRQPRGEAPQQPATPWTRLRLRLLDEPPIRDARGARRLARPALYAQVPVLDDAGLDAGASLKHRLHQRDAAPRRLRLEARLDVGGARVEAEAAVDALVEVLLTGRVRADEPRRQDLAARAGRHYSPPTNRPGLSRPCGSYCRLSPSMTANPPTGGPHGSTPSMGARDSTTTVPPKLGDALPQSADVRSRHHRASRPRSTPPVQRHG